MGMSLDDLARSPAPQLYQQGGAEQLIPVGYRIPARVNARLAERAEREGRPINDLVIEALSVYLQLR